MQRGNAALSPLNQVNQVVFRRKCSQQEAFDASKLFFCICVTGLARALLVELLLELEPRLLARGQRLRVGRGRVLVRALALLHGQLRLAQLPLEVLRACPV